MRLLLSRVVLYMLLGVAVCAPDSGSAADNATESAEDAAGSKAERVLPPVTDNHRPLRGNPPLDDAAAMRDSASVTAMPEDAGFSVVPRTPQLTWYPCDRCHQYLPINLNKRKLFSPHPGVVAHGAEQFWCHDCHNPEEKSELKTLAGETYDFDTAYQVCAQCHYAPRRDWFHGAHGKRVANWQGTRQVYNCTHCHDPHNPALRPRAPQPPPPVRARLERAAHSAHEKPAVTVVEPENDKQIP